MSKDVSVESRFSELYGDSPEQIKTTVGRLFPKDRIKPSICLNPDQYLQHRDDLRMWRAPVIVRPFTYSEIAKKILHNPAKAFRRLTCFFLKPASASTQC